MGLVTGFLLGGGAVIRRGHLGSLHWLMVRATSKCQKQKRNKNPKLVHCSIVPSRTLPRLPLGRSNYFQPDVVCDFAYTICWTGVVSPVVCISGIRLIRTAYRRMPESR